MGFRLRDDLYFCRSGDRAVFLDLRTGRYFTLPKQIDAAFQALVEGEPAVFDESGFDRLTKLGLLTEWPGKARPEPCSLMYQPRDSMLDAAIPRAGLWSLTTASIALARAETELRVVALHRIITGVIRTKNSGILHGGAPSEPTGTAGAFAALTRWISARDRCLPRSIAMTRLLFSEGVPVDMVFGVASRPFRAHCWVQLQSTVLNDRLENVQNYTPILVI